MQESPYTSSCPREMLFLHSSTHIKLKSLKPPQLISPTLIDTESSDTEHGDKYSLIIKYSHGTGREDDWLVGSTPLSVGTMRSQ